MTKILVVVLSDQTSAEMSPKCFQKPIKNVNQNFDASVADPLEKRSFPKNRRYKGQCLTEFIKIYSFFVVVGIRELFCFCFDEPLVRKLSLRFVYMTRAFILPIFHCVFPILTEFSTIHPILFTQPS